MVWTSSITMPSMVGIVRRGPAVDEKVWCFLSVCLSVICLFVTLWNYVVCDNRNAMKQWNFQNNKKYVLSNSESVQCNFSIFDHLTFIQFKICCCVQKFMKIGWFFTEIWRYIDFQNGVCPPSWNCLTTIRDHPRSLCCRPQLPVKFHVNLIQRSEDIQGGPIKTVPFVFRCSIRSG